MPNNNSNITLEDTSIDTVVSLQMATYFLLFTMGTLGNIWVMRLMVSIYKAQRTSTFLNRHTIFVYIFALSVTDVCIVLTIPLLLTQMATNEWVWPGVVCQVYLARPSLQIGPPTEDGHTAVWVSPAEAAELVENDGDRLFLRRFLL